MKKISSTPNNLIRLLGAIPYILCIVLILIPFPHIAAQANLVLNGAFEGGIEGWSGGIHETTTLHSGTGSLKVADTSSAQDINATTTEIISIEPQLTYYIEMWIRGERDDQPVQVVINQYAGQQWISGANKLLDVSATTEWTLFRAELSDWRHNTSGVTLTLRPTPYQGSDPNGAQGTAFFDDIVLIPYAANLVENGSFESGTTGWTGAGSITKSHPHVGSQAVIISDQTTDASIRQTSDLIPIFAEREYFLETYVRAENKPHKVSIVISQFDAERKWISKNNLAFFPEVGTNWTRFTKILDSFNPATHYITIGLNPTFWEASSTGTAVFDDVQLRHYEGNLVLNSNLESGSGAWTCPDPGAYKLSHDFANSGEFSLHITDRSTSKDFDVSIDDLIPVFEDKDYLLQAWMRAAYDGQRSTITVGQYDQDQAHISGQNFYYNVSISPSGTLFQRIIQDLDPRTAYVRISVNPVPWTSGGTNTGEVWFDDVRFYPYDGNQIANGDFERGLHNWAGDDLTPLKTSNSYEGAISLGITDASTTAHATATTKEFIPIAQGESYSFSAWVYTANPSQPPQMTLQQFAGETVDDWISGKNLTQNFVSEFEPQTETVRANLSPVPWTANRDLTGTAVFDQVIFRHEPVAGTWLSNAGSTQPWLSNAGSTQLWWAPPDQKVLRRMEPVAGSAIDSSIHIAGAGGESEAFQLVLTPAGATQLRDASLSLSNGVTTLPATISQVGYLPISEPTEAGSFPGCEFPDPLLPLDPAHPTTLDANENQPHLSRRPASRAQQSNGHCAR